MKQREAVVLFLAALLGSQASAQTTRFETYPLDTFTTAEGTFNLPFEIGKVKVTGDNGQFEKARAVTKPYVDYMQGIVNAYTGRERECFNGDFFFMPGATESAFRASEQAFHKTLTVSGFKGSDGSGKYVTKKAIPAKTLSQNLTGSFYIYKPVYAAKGKTAEAQYVLGFFFDKNLKQGSMISCHFFDQ